MEENIINTFIQQVAFEQAVYNYSYEQNKDVIRSSVTALISSEVATSPIHNFAAGYSKFFDAMFQENNAHKTKQFNQLCEIVLRVGERVDFNKLRQTLLSRWAGLLKTNVAGARSILSDSTPDISDDISLFVYAYRLFADEIALEILSYGPNHNPVMGKQIELPIEIKEALARMGVK